MPATALKRPFSETRNIKREVLPNGLIVLSEEMSHIRSISIGIWMKTGSRDELAERNGISHFVEHMLFKGTTTRTAQEIAREVDSIGGNIDAFTGKETICFNIKVLDEHVPIAIDILSDLVLNPVFTPKDITREKRVILEELKMDEDNPDYLVHEIFSSNFWKDHPLGKPILGTRETVKRFDRQMMENYYRDAYSPANLVITAAGNLTHKMLTDLAGEHFSGMKPRKTVSSDRPPQTHARIALRNKKSLDQIHPCPRAPPYPSPP